VAALLSGRTKEPWPRAPDPRGPRFRSTSRPPRPSAWRSRRHSCSGRIRWSN